MATIQGIYVALFGRPADPAGLAFFNAATSGGADLTAIGDLAATDEYQDRFDGMDNEEIITEIYQSLFGRDPEEAGLAFFAAALEDGTLSINNIAIAILDGAQGTDAQIIENKLVAANRFTLSLDTQAEIDAYSGTEAADAGRAFLAGVTADPLTIPTLAETDAAIGAIVGEGGVVGALGVLEAALDAQSDALEAIALADNANEDDGEAVLEGTALTAFVDAYDTAAPVGATSTIALESARAETAVGTADTAVATAEAALATARAANTDAALQSSYSTALAAARADATVNARLNARDNAAALVDADVSANGTNVEILTAMRDAIGAYIGAGGDTSLDLNGTDDVATVLTAINTALATATPEASAEAYLLAFTAAATSLDGTLAGGTDEALQDVADTAADRAALLVAEDAAQTALNVAGAGATLVAAETALETREGLIADVADAEAALAEAQAYLDQLEALIDAHDDAGDDVAGALAAFGDLGFEEPILTDGAAVGTAGNDIFVADEDGIISSFGTAGNDLLFIGSDYASLNIEDDVDLDGATDTAGSASALEVFVQQQGGNTVLYIEQEAVEGNSTSGVFGGTVITLVGVDADSLSFQDGYFSIA